MLAVIFSPDLPKAVDTPWKDKNKNMLHKSKPGWNELMRPPRSYLYSVAGPFSDELGLVTLIGMYYDEYHATCTMQHATGRPIYQNAGSLCVLGPGGGLRQERHSQDPKSLNR